MKKIFIITAVVILFLAVLGGGWFYLLLNGAPENIPNIFARFGTAESSDTPPVRTGDENDATVRPGATTKNLLAQLTTNQIAGATFVERDGELLIRYAERGTGHLFEISLVDGAETRISNTIVPLTTDATWSSTGNRVALIREGGETGREVFVGVITQDDQGSDYLDGFTLSGNTENILFNEIGDSLYYTVTGEDDSVGYIHNLKTDKITELFTTPLNQITMLWGTTEDYVYTKPSGEFLGFLYKVTNTGLDRVGESGLGLMAERLGSGAFLLSRSVESGVISEIIDLENNSTSTAISAFPTKCDYDGTENVLWCAAPPVLPDGVYPDIWYQGAVSLNDLIWRIDVTSGHIELIADPEAEAGRLIDATNLEVGPDGSRILFMNKNNNTLWLLTP